MADTWEIDFKDKTELNAKTRNSTSKGDPRGEYPTPEYFYKSSVSNQTYKLSIGGGDPSIDLGGIVGTTPNSSDYSQANIRVTKSGHALIFEDAGGEERIILRHKDGTGIEMRQDGSMIMRTETNMITSVGGSGVLIIDGDLKVSCKNVELDATGDMDMRVAGDYNLTVDGHKTETIKGSDRQVVTGNKSTTVTGNVNTTTVGTVTDTILGNATNIIKGYYNNIVGGTYSMAVKGFSRFTSQTEVAISSGNINMAAADLSIFGAAGTIGGANVTHYGKNYFGNSAVFTGGLRADGITSSRDSSDGVLVMNGMTAATFTGDLTGTADKSIITSKQDFAENLIVRTVDGAASIYTNVNTATSIADSDGTCQPTTTILTDYLGNSDRGIQKVVIDSGDHIKNKINLTTKTGGLSKRDLSVREIRAKLKDENNAANAEFLQYIHTRGLVSEDSIKKIPTEVGRSYDGNIAYLPHKMAAMLGESVLIKSQRAPKKLLPDSRYNPMAKRPEENIGSQFTSKINPYQLDRKSLLGYGIPMSTFLVNGVTLGHLASIEERLDLARQLLLQTEVIKFYKNTKQFKNFRLVVAEGVYKAEDNETLKEDSIPHLAQTGRAITYELYNQNNVIDPFITFNFATRLADSLFAYDKIILDYDTLEKKLNSQIIVTMPKVSEDFEYATNPRMGYETRYNNKIMSNTDLIEMGSSTPPAAHKDPITNNIFVFYNVVGQTRDKRVKAELETALGDAAKTAGIDFITIISGAQPGSTLKRIGSTRHDTGLAADIKLTKNGRFLDASRIQDQAIMSEFLVAAKANGILAGGMSKNFMGNNTMHLDMLGAFKDGSYDKKTIVTWESDPWFTYALKFKETSTGPS